MCQNPLYIHGLKRTAANLQLLISPFAQMKYESFMLMEETSEKAANYLLLKKVPYHFEFCIFNLLELVFFCKIGIIIFEKQDLK